MSRLGTLPWGGVAAGIALASALAAVGPAWAQPAAERALAECRAARPHEAVRACLQRLHGARPQVAALCELGRLEEGAGQPVEAYEAYRRCLAESTAAPAADALRQARARVADLATRLALLLVRADQPGATVTVGGQPRGGAARGPIAVRPGNHRLQVDAPGCRPWRDIINVAAGEMREVTAQLAKETVRGPSRTPRPGATSAGARPAAVEEIPAGPEGGLEAEILLERALDAEEAGAAAAARAAAWCDLAVVDGDNPHRSRARSRCVALEADGESRARLRVAMAAEQRALAGYLTLRRKGDAAKVAAVEKFLRLFGALRGDQAYTEGVLDILAHAPEALRRRICGRVGPDRLPTVTVSVRPVNERGGLLVGRAFVDGRVIGSAPGTFAVPACADRIGVGLGDGPATWEHPLPRGARTAEIRAVFRRFVASGDTVKDTATGRVWQRRTSSDAHTFAGAQRYCQLLPGVGWRLPAHQELEGLVERRGPPTIDPEVFVGTYSESYWTSTSHPDQRYHVYVVSFASGEPASRFVGQEARTRCVK